MNTLKYGFSSDINKIKESFRRLNSKSKKDVVRDIFKYIKENSKQEYNLYLNLWEESVDGEFNPVYYAPLYIDIDTNSFELSKINTQQIVLYISHLFQIPLDEIRIFFSGAKGFHILIDSRLFGNPQDSNMHNIYKDFILILKDRFNLNLDTAIYDLRRVFRMINSINHKKKYHKIELTAKELFTLTKEQILNKAKGLVTNFKHYIKSPIPAASAKMKDIIFFIKTQHEKKKKELEERKIRQQQQLQNGKINICTFPCIQSLLNSVVYEGERHNALLIIGSYYKQLLLRQNPNISPNDLHARLDELIFLYNEDHCSPSLDMREVNNAVRFALNYSTGCSKIHDYGFCLKEKCNRYKRKY